MKIISVLAAIVMVSASSFGAFILISPTSDTYVNDDDTLVSTVSNECVRTYSWTSGGEQYTVTLDMDSKDISNARGTMSSARNLQDDLSNGLSFITPDDSYVKSVAQQIKDQLDKNKVTSKALIANYVLDFVQMCIAYEYDSTQYGTDEYWALPVETLYSGMGDCEDTTFLYSSIMKCLGYDTVVCYAMYSDSGHAFTLISMSGISGKSYNLNGSTVKYYCCETTPDGEDCALADIGISIMYYSDIQSSYCFKTSELGSKSPTCYAIKSVSSWQPRPFVF